MLVDTTTFVCGHYRAKRSEHVLRVALGRDVRRDFGSLLPSLGIRIAMTEETAMRVRAEWNGRLEPGVRQLPVEAISTGRAGSNKHAVLLYEALRGSVAGDHVWQSYAHCCFKGFSCMLRGEYAKALEAYSRIREISDLETGLMPACLGREAAPSFATGGAISTQVNRLMKECRRCVAQHITRGYCRTRRAPPGVGSTTHADLNAAGQGAVAAAPSTLSSSQAALATFQPQKQRRSRQQPRIAPAATGVWSPSRGLPDAVPAAPFSLPVSAESRQRYLVTTFDASGAAMRHVLGDPPHRIRDNFGCKWTLSQPFRCVTGGSVDNVYVVGLSSTGAPCYASQLILREVRSIVSRAVNGAPDGFLTDALRSAVPVRDPTPQQRAQLRAVVNTHCTLSHPSLLLPTAYSLSVEGVVVLLYPFFPGCSMRELLRRYPRMSPFTATGFTLPALTALAHMHAENIAHGAFSLDNIIAAPDGSSRLITRCCGHRVARELCAVPPTCYVSPAMAAGAAPTPACDVFCYGLMCLEILTRGRVWKWAAPAGEAGLQQRTATELTALLADCGKPFCDAVAQGVLVPDTDVLDEVVSTNLYREVMTATVRACLSFDPTQRPTAKQLCAVTRILASREAGAVQPSCLQGKKGTD
jgi:phage baseplate assembly protein W